jgi:hypothetical protein
MFTKPTSKEKSLSRPASRSRTPVKDAVLVASLTTLVWTACAAYGIHTGHVAYYPVVQVVQAPQTQPVALYQSDDALLAAMIEAKRRP